MRIPSQFNDRSLYRTKDRRSSVERSATNDAYRKLFRLGIALILVVVVMQQASQPRMYSVFFGAQQEQWKSMESFPRQGGSATLVSGAEQSGPPASEQAGVRASETPDTGDVVEADASGVGPDDPAATKVAAQFVMALDVADQRRWLVLLARWSDSVNQKQIAASGGVLDENTSDEDSTDVDSNVVGSGDDSLFAKSMAALDKVNDIDPESRKRWASTIESFLPKDASVEENSLDGPESPATATEVATESMRRLIALRDALDQAAMGRVRDGTFWGAADSDAFYFQLDQSGWLPSDGAAVTGTLPLLQQPEVYRGQRLKIVGSIGLVETADAKSNAYGIRSYKKVWVIPSDGGNRPILLIVANLPESIEGAIDDQGQWVGDSAGGTAEITAVGRFIKRLPYRSSIGADLAPAVIGRITAQKTISTVATGPSAAPPKEHRRAILWLAMAIIAGVALAAWLMYRTGIAAKQSRKLRASNHSSLDMGLESLANQYRDANDAVEISERDNGLDNVLDGDLDGQKSGEPES